jgi:chloride channel protein, CIC family
LLSRGGYIPLKTTIFHFFAPVICIGSGGTVGPEGPAAQLGGGVSSKVCQLIGLSDTRRRVFTAAGSGAAIAAIFNTPLGGVFFAIELILLNDFSAPTLSAVILASVTASTISRELT